MNTRNDRAIWLQGHGAQCRFPPKARLDPPRLILLGTPGIGRATHAEMLCSGLGICHLATGDIFRSARNRADGDLTPEMTEAVQFMQHGALVPDATVINLIRERRTCLNCPGGFLLDGFPRTIAQAVALDEMLEQEGLRVEAVLNYTLPFPALVQRIAGRRTCQECHAVFHVTEHPPRVADVCDHCGGILAQSENDLPEAATARLLANEHKIKPLVNYYLAHGLIRTISAEGPPERVYQRTLAILDL
jgi:adenylate kinase